MVDAWHSGYRLAAISDLLIGQIWRLFTSGLDKLKYLRQIFAALVLGAVVSGCAPSNTMPVATDATATPGTSLLDPGVNRALNTKLIGWNSGGTSPASKQLNFIYRVTNDPNVVEVYVNKVWYKLDYAPSRFGFIGGADGKMIEIFPQFTSADNQVAQVYIAHYASDLNFLYAGYGIYGIPTKQSEINALSGTATFTGRAGMALWDNNLNFSDGKGPAVLRVDFASNSIEGEFDISESGFSDVGHLMPSTRIVFAPTTITGSSFVPILLFNVSDFGFDGAPAYAADGQFYGVNGSSVGGTFFGQATKNGGLSNVKFQGAFTADQ